MMKPTRMTDSSLTTYSSCEMAVAIRPAPRMTEPVLVMRLGEEGSLLISSEARSGGGGGLVDMVRLHIQKSDDGSGGHDGR